MRVGRVSFSGELAFEVNVNGWYAPAVWERLIAAGEPFGITPYGTETMHVLRAEKGYPIIGQDTDGTVTPQDLGMDWAVSKKKPDFIGKRSFTRAENLNPMRKQFVGLLPLDRETVLPEGAQIIETGRRRRPAAAARADARPRHLQLPQRRTGPAVRAWLWSRAGEPASVTPCTSPWTARWCPSRSPAPSSSIPKEHAAMAETLTATSPLQGWSDEVRRTCPDCDDEGGAVRRDGRPVGRPGWARRRSRASAILGVALPTTPSTYVSNDTLTVIWFGPEEWLITAGARSAAALEARCERPWASTAARRSTSPRSAPRCGCAVRMPVTCWPRAARLTCTDGCSAKGTAAQTMLGLAGVVLIALDDAGTDYRILVRSSFARYLADWLIDAAEEFGVRY